LLRWLIIGSRKILPLESGPNYFSLQASGLKDRCPRQTCCVTRWDAGFTDVHVELAVDVEPGSWVLDWDRLLALAPNPNAPTAGETIGEALTLEEAERFEAHLRPLVDSGRAVRRSAFAYLPQKSCSRHSAFSCRIAAIFLNRVSQVRFLPRAPPAVVFRVMLDVPASPDVCTRFRVWTRTTRELSGAGEP
jgi:hypothetical protein